jgi:hypothetical protein
MPGVDQDRCVAKLDVGHEESERERAIVLRLGRGTAHLVLGRDQLRVPAQHAVID